MHQNLSGEWIMQLENGNYSFAVMAVSLAGQGPWTATEYVFIDVSILMGTFSNPPLNELCL